MVKFIVGLLYKLKNYDIIFIVGHIILIDVYNNIYVYSFTIIRNYLHD